MDAIILIIAHYPTGNDWFGQKGGQEMISYSDLAAGAWNYRPVSDFLLILATRHT